MAATRVKLRCDWPKQPEQNPKHPIFCEVLPSWPDCEITVDGKPAYNVSGFTLECRQGQIPKATLEFIGGEVEAEVVLDPMEREANWTRGYRAAATRTLQHALLDLLPELEGKDPRAELAKLVLEREQVVAVLRGICEDHGDNDWPNDLSLSDVLRKHLEPYLDADEEEDPDEGNGGR